MDSCELAPADFSAKRNLEEKSGKRLPLRRWESVGFMSPSWGVAVVVEEPKNAIGGSAIR